MGKVDNYIRNMDIINSIAERCNEETFIEDVESQYCGKSKHYIVDGLHVYIGEYGDKIVANQPANWCDSRWQTVKGKPEIILSKMYRNDNCNLFVSIDNEDKPYVEITYESNGAIDVDMAMDQYFIGAPIYEVEHQPEEGIETVLDKALQVYNASPESKKILEQARIFYNSVLSVYKGENSLTSEFENLSEKELQDILEGLKRNNKAKEQELEAAKREQLLRQIRAEQQKGEKLDKLISAIKDNMNKGVEVYE